MIGILSLVLSLPIGNDLFPYEDAEAELSVEIRTPELKAHVYRLSSAEFMGRRGAGAARASAHIAHAFEHLHLQPAFGDSYFQPIPWLVPDSSGKVEGFVGRNVGAILPGSDPQLADEWIVLSAHFDHLGVQKGAVYPGADDNASGVAMLLEVAEHFALQKDKPRRSIMFVGFDQEEAGLLGSTHFAVHPPRDIKKIKASLTADMIGRSMVNLMDEYVFALGSESSPALRNLIEEVKPPDGLKIGRVGADLIGTRSDYGPFRDRHIPYLFFSTGQHPDYHQPSDLPERVDYEKLRKICLWISDLTETLANADKAPAWEEKGLAPDLEEVRTIRLLVARVMENPQTFALTSKQKELVAGAQERMEGMIKRGRVTSGERTWLLWTARLMMATVF